MSETCEIRNEQAIRNRNYRKISGDRNGLTRRVDIAFVLSERHHHGDSTGRYKRCSCIHRCISRQTKQDFEGSLQEGVAELHVVVETAPDLAAPQIDLGIAYHLSGDLEAAESHLDQALVLNPEHPVAHNELGIIYRKTGRFAEAKKSYQSALAIYPGYHHARRNLAILCDLYLGDLKCALENYEAYMSTVPSDDEAEIWIADLRYRMDQ